MSPTLTNSESSDCVAAESPAAACAARTGCRHGEVEPLYGALEAADGIWYCAQGLVAYCALTDASSFFWIFDSLSLVGFSDTLR